MFSSRLFNSVLRFWIFNPRFCHCNQTLVHRARPYVWSRTSVVYTGSVWLTVSYPNKKFSWWHRQIRHAKESTLRVLPTRRQMWGCAVPAHVPQTDTLWWGVGEESSTYEVVYWRSVQPRLLCMLAKWIEGENSSEVSVKRTKIDPRHAHSSRTDDIMT